MTAGPAPRSPLPRVAALLAVVLLGALWGSRCGRRAPTAVPDPLAAPPGDGPAPAPPPTDAAPAPADDGTAADAAPDDAAPAAPLAGPLPPLPAFDSAFCATPGEEPLDIRRPSMAAYFRAHAGRPEAARLQASMAAERRHDHAAARAHLAAAYRLAPDAALALPLATRLATTADLAAALAALDDYLRDTPADLDASRLRARLRIQEELQRDFLRSERYGVTLLWPPGTLSDADAGGLLRDVTDALDRAARLTETRRRPELTVVVYRDVTDLHATTCATLWTDGGFDGTLRLAYTPKAPGGVRPFHVAHETLHAQVREFAPSFPVWFHEALAQYFSDEEGAGQRRAWAFMVKHQTFIPFGSMVGTFMDFPGNSDAALAYSQSLAMLLLLLEKNGPRVIPDGVRLMSSGTPAAELFDKLAAPGELDGHDLLSFLARRR